MAVVISVQTARSQRRNEARAARQAWVTDFSAWLDAGRVHMVMADETVPLDREWVAIGDRLSASAQTMIDPGANWFLVAAKDARVHMATVPDAKRFRVGRLIGSLIKLWAVQWVDDPKTHDDAPNTVAQWIDAWAFSDDPEDGPTPVPAAPSRDTGDSAAPSGSTP